MNKDNIIEKLHQARAEHVVWVREGRNIVKGMPEEKVTRPHQCDACQFTLWYESQGHKLVNVPQIEALQDLHHELHKAYTALFFTTFDRRKKARATIISDGIETPIDELPFRRKKLKVLETKTIKFIKLLIAIEKKVESMEEEVFENGWLV